MLYSPRPLEVLLGVPLDLVTYDQIAALDE